MSMGALLFTTATSPVHLVDLADLNFTVADQTFQTMNSAILAMSTRTEVNFGVVNLFSHLAREFGQGDFWVYFSAAPQRDSAASYGDSAASHGDSVPSYPYLPPKEGVTLTSMAIDASRPPIGQVRRTRSYASFIADPSSLRWRDVKLLRLVYDFDVVTIGDLVFSDCARGSFYLLVDLVNKAGDEKKELPIYLGSSDGFKSGCERAARQLNGRNLVKNQDPRVAGGMTIRGSQHRYGYLYVRSISVVVDRGEGDSHANHRVRLYTAKVNGTWLAGLGASGDPYTAPEPVQIEVPSDLSPLKQ
jgi:hypothetical protein